MGDQLKKIKTRGYSISKVNLIRQALAGYGGGSAIASEMIQNADDAKASQITFHFTEQSLIVRNDSVFSDKDFDSITEIAKGEKASEAGQIGTWGTGFLSVFHITDAPELRSSGEHIIFDPSINYLDVYESNIVDSTEFRLPWRIKPTELSQRLEADTWSAEQILDLKNNLANDIYRLILFLRHVNIIEVYEGNTEPKLVARVERKPPAEYTNDKFTRLQQEIEYKRAGQQPRTDTWLYYWGQIPTELRPTGVAIKDSRLAIAFPLKKSGWLDQNIPAALYNFLPTPIKTELPFQINGAFFPDNNRRSILLDEATQREKSSWNRQVLRQTGHLFVDAVLDMQEQVTDVRRFYELLPVSEPRRSFLEPVQKPFIETAATLPIVFTSLNDWRKPSEVFIGRRGSRLPELAGDYLPVLPTGVPQNFRDFLEKELKSSTLKIKDVLDYLRPHLEPDSPLTSAHPMINRRDKLEILYGEISGPISENIPELIDFAICLTENQTLWPFREIWQADKATRRLLVGTDIRFIDIRMQQKFRTWLGKLVGEFKGSELVEWLGQQAWPEIGVLNTGIIGQQIGTQLSKRFQPSPPDRKQDSAPLTLGEPPSFIRDAKHLADILRFIAQDLPRVDKNILSRLPLIRTEEDYLLYPSQLYRHDDPEERATLKKLNLHFVHAEWSNNKDIWSVYEQAGVKHLEAHHVIDVLPETMSKWTERPDDELIVYLLTLYQYFERCRLEERDKAKLRQLPLCVTQQGHLIPAQGGKVTPHLPSTHDSLIDKQIRQHLDKLDLDNLVHSQLIARGKRFLTNVLLVKALSPVRLIETVIVPHYQDPRLDDVARRDLLHYISEQLRSMSSEQQRALLPKLANEPLIQCANGEYYPGRSVYFASPALDTIFANGYHKLHPDYDVSVAQADDADQSPPYRHSTWYWLFEHLGVNEHPTPADLVRAVHTIVEAGPPDQARVEAVRRIYELLNREVGKRQPERDDELKDLANLAWLPAHNDDMNWYKPTQLYQASHADLVGVQVSLLRFQESTTELRQLLKMPTFPTVDIIANHLLASAQENKKVERRVYDEIGRRWDDLEDPLQQRLKCEAIVWGDGDKYWPANRVFLGDYHRELFGQRRCYLKPPGGDAQEFLQYIGVKERPDDWRASILFLQEISADYTNNQPVSEHDLQLLYRNFDHLGHQLLSANNKSLQNDLNPLTRCKLVPAKDSYLYLPTRIVLDAPQDIVKQFDPDAIPIVLEDKLTENGYRFLRQLGASPLSQLIKRRPVDTTGSQEDVSLSLRLQQLIPAFQRMALTYQEQNGTISTSDLPQKRLLGIKLRVCPKLVVGYELDNRDGWHVAGHSRPEEALYFSDGKQLNYLYVRRTKPAQFPYVALARELERILFPNSKESPVIEQLLKTKPAEVDGYLDEHGYRRLYQDESDSDTSDHTEQGLVDWGEADDSPPVWEQPDTPENKGVEQPSLLIPTQIPLPASSQIPPAADKPEIETEPTAPPQPEQPQIEEGQAEPESISPQPMDAESPLPTDRVASSPEKTMQSADDPAKEADIPPFTGQRWPISIRQPNDYARLSQEFGLPLDTNKDNKPTQASDDAEWESAQQGREKKANTDYPITTVRFTLKYQNRYEGFLPLHSRARQMLADQPKILTCLTDYPDEWTFKLYVDYSNAGMIYNEDRLPQFFEAFNIPAGGIVYLERLEAHHTVRLFWNNAEQTVQDVKRHELMENGEIDEFSTDMEVPCEINEHILRAETRLEDIEAFIRKSIGQPGVFTLICDAFGDDKAELSYNEIFERVQSKRPVADRTIRAELYARPCFVPLGDNRWRFESSRGDTPIIPDHKTAGHQPKTKSPTRTQNPIISQQPEQPSKSDGPESTPQQSAPSSEPSPPSLPPSPYHIVLNEAQQEWQALSDFFNPDGQDPADRLQALAEQLSRLAQRLQLSLTALAQSVPETDDLLAATWQDLDKNPGDTKRGRKLQQYLREKFTQEEHETLLAQVDRLLVQTAPQHRDLVFFPLLSDIANQLAEDGDIAPSRKLYKLLQEQGAGDFQAQLQQLKKYDEVQEYIDLVQIAETVNERWQVWYDAWQEYPGYPALRRAIQADVKSRVATAEQAVDSSLNQKNVQTAIESYLSLLANINPLLDAWQTDQTLAPRIWGLAQRIFETLRDIALQDDNVKAYQQALQVVARLPVQNTLNLPGNIYVEAVRTVAGEFANKSDNLAAAALMDYGIYLVKENHWPVDDYVLSDAYEYTGRLYENLAMIHRAYNFIKQAQRKSTGGKKTQLGHRAYALHQQRYGAKKQDEIQSWQTQIEALLNKSHFSQLVNPEMFRSFCNQK